tara:strand:+ start:8541 stop:10004 length:1464 start_codon:yes stop_codon:yes gene_type:complete
MKKPSNENILNFYQSDLSIYYNIDKEGVLIWNEDFLNQYWHNFSKFIELNGNELEGLTIPKCSHLALTHGLFDLELDELIFSNCIFLDEVYFENLKIKKVMFSSCTFDERLAFSSYNFDLEIKSSTFGKSLEFYNCEINTFRLSHNKIFDSIYLKDSIVFKTFIMDYLSVGESISVEKCTLSPSLESEISGIEAINKNIITYKDFSIVEKHKSDFIKKPNDDGKEGFSLKFLINKDEFINYVNKLPDSELGMVKEELIRKINIIDYEYKYTSYEPVIKLENVVITHPITFYSINLKNFYFRNSNIEKVIFSNCDWNITDRLVLAEEYIKSGTQIENQFRQLKRIFSKDHNWSMSGFAYISEMKMTRRRLGYSIDDGKRYLSKDALEYIIYFFYEKIGGYTQNFTRPLTIFLISTFIVFPLIYVYFEPVTEIKYDFTFALKKSISNAFPIVKLDGNIYTYWSLKAFQIIFSTILLTFIVLGLRKRFKQ